MNRTEKIDWRSLKEGDHIRITLDAVVAVAGSSGMDVCFAGHGGTTGLLDHELDRADIYRSSPPPAIGDRVVGPDSYACFVRAIAAPEGVALVEYESPGGGADRFGVWPLEKLERANV